MLLFLDRLTLEDGANRLSPKAGRLLPTHAI